MVNSSHSQLIVIILSTFAAIAVSQVVTYTRLEQYQHCMQRFQLFRRKLIDIRRECPAPVPHSCCHLKGTFFAARSGVYEIKDVCSVGSSKAFGYCDMDTDDGGWLVIQRRINGEVPFNRTLTEYQNGFGDPSGEFWYGLKNIRCLTQDGPVELRIDLEYPNGTTGYVYYKSFTVAAGSTYRATVQAFKTTPGVNSDMFDPRKRYGRSYIYYPNFVVKANCGGNPKVGGWWDTSCRGNPNGPGPGENSTVYAMWNGDVVTKTEIKIRERNCITSLAFRCLDYQQY